jgi:hypothetical protein
MQYTFTARDGTREESLSIRVNNGVLNLNLTTASSRHATVYWNNRLVYEITIDGKGFAEVKSALPDEWEVWLRVEAERMKEKLQSPPYDKPPRRVFA